jgi:hypothetical protein
MRHACFAILLCLLVAPSWAAPAIDFKPPAAEDEAALAQEMKRLARQVLAAAPAKEDRAQRLDRTFRAQLVLDDVAAALKSLAALKRLNASPSARAYVLPYDLHVLAQRRASQRRVSFEAAFQTSFREVFSKLDDQAAALAIQALSVNAGGLQRSLQFALGQFEEPARLSLDQAAALIRTYQAVQTFRSLPGTVGDLIAEDDARRYVIERNVQVATGDGATVCVTIARPRAARLTALLEFTIYADAKANFANPRRSASHGYAGVVGLTRGKGCSPGTPEPYVHDGRDAAALIDWIAAQPWSDGRVGMFGGSYNGFSAWAAAKHRPRPLKGIMTGSAAGPGLDFPMEGGVFWNFVYPWPFYTTNNKWLDNETYNDGARWRTLNRKYYADGAAYADLEKLDGTPNPVFATWLKHPTYDAYWRGVIPSDSEYGAIDIPALTTVGYYYGGPGAGTHYFSEHTKHRPQAEHYLVAGPYDHTQAQRGTISALGDRAGPIAGYELDPAAHIDLVEMRYQWFDYLFRGRAKPALLADRVNYQLPGANTWRHAPSIDAMARQTKRFHLLAEPSGTSYTLGEAPGQADAFTTLTVDLADRSDIDAIIPGGGVEDMDLDRTKAVVFTSAPLPADTDIAGVINGRLEFSVNKKDFDFDVSLFAETPKRKYLQLQTYFARASHVGDLRVRQLLQVDRRTALSFRGWRLGARRVPQGSRLIVVLSVIKNPGQQINYGTGKDVSRETIADAGAPLSIKWYSTSYVDVPLSPVR